jgi:cytochrome c oxidase subunit 3
MEIINPFQIPLLNTLVLLRSGVSVTLAHHQIISNKNFRLSLFFTVFLGLYFTILQIWEYFHSCFSIRDSSFGRIFFIATGFHGGHVLVGSVFF